MSVDHQLRLAAAVEWQAQLDHPFVAGLGDGSLSRERFQHYVAQDFVFLVDYGRLLALATARAPDLPTMRRFAELTQAILVAEMDLHRAFAAEWGIAEDVLAATEPTAATRAYVDALLRTAALGDFCELVAVVLPCMWSYADIGVQLAANRDAGRTDPGPYAPWVNTYSSAEFTDLADWCRTLLRDVADGAPPAAHARIASAFRGAAAHEVRFWDASWNLEPPLTQPSPQPANAVD
jgi:thiaminase/transcriptional activator TenA